MLKLDLYKAAARFIERLPAKHRRQIATKISELRTQPFPQDAKPLKGHAYPYFRADQGEYRIIYGVEDATLRVFLVGKRNDDEVYRRLRRT
jgi:mRNA interferase RelE/StbE